MIGHPSLPAPRPTPIDPMQTHKLVLPEHLNHYGFLFGGNMLKWVDEVAWIAASLECPGRHFVTVGLDKVEFRRKVTKGAILTFSAARTRTGSTSLTFEVSVAARYTESPGEGADEPVFSTHVTLVRVDAGGRKVAIDS